MRIIGGTVRGRRIRAPKDPRVRPTADRVREALFNILGKCVEGANVLDLFAGSGALGLEALSRGAARTVFVERARMALRLLRGNAAALGFEGKSRLLTTDWRSALSLLAGEGDAFDLLLADPPYEKGGGEGVASEVVKTLAAAPYLFAPGAVLILEHFRKEEVDAERSTLDRFRRETYGDTVLSFYRLKETDAAGPSAMKNSR